MEVTAAVKEIVAKHGLKIDSWRGGVGNFRDVYAGTGADVSVLQACVKELKERIPNNNLFPICVTRVNVKEHPDFGKPFIEIPSVFWVE